MIKLLPVLDGPMIKLTLSEKSIVEGEWPPPDTVNRFIMNPFMLILQ